MLLKDRVAIITGGSRGIGKGIALKFVEEGCSVAIVGVTSAGEKTLKEIKSMGGSGIFIQSDVSNSQQVQNTVSQVISHYGKVDILVNNAAIGPTPKNITEISDAEYDQVLAVNLKGPFLYCKAVTPYMKEKKYGKIINISSLAAVAPLATEVHYSAAKAGMLGLSLDLAFELAAYNICVNSILPGITDTDALNGVIPPGRDKYEFLSGQIRDMVPLRRLGTPLDVAGAALFLASELSAFITGDRIIVGGGSPLLPMK